MVSYLLKFVTISQHIIDVEYGDVRGVRRIGVERKECTHMPSFEGAIIGTGRSGCITISVGLCAKDENQQAVIS